MKKKIFSLKMLTVAVIILAAIGWACTSSNKIQTGNMSGRQSMLKSVYPVLTKVTRFFGVNSRAINPENKTSSVTSVFEIPFELNNGDTMSLQAWKGKKIIVVNTLVIS